MSSRLQENDVLGPYKVIRFVGRGGMGEVYEAYEERLARRVALKIISNRTDPGDSLALSRFMAEAKALAQIQHQNVVSIFAIDEIDGQKFIAMEFLEGLPIDSLRKRFVLDSRDAGLLLLQMLEGLKALHDKSIVHRDIKPGNIILQKNGVVKFIDFGLAKRLDATSEDTVGSNEFYGTPRYLAPEVAAGSPAHAGSDIFCLGLVFYELFSGHRFVDPEGQQGPLSILQSYSSFQFKASSKVKRLMTAPMYRILVKMLQPKIQNRYRSVDDIIEDLKPLTKHSRKPGDEFFENLCAPQPNFNATFGYLQNQLQYDDIGAKRIMAIALGTPQYNQQLDDSITPTGTELGPRFLFEKVMVDSAQQRYERTFDPKLVIQADAISGEESLEIRMDSPSQSLLGKWGQRLAIAVILVVGSALFSKTKWGQGFLASEVARSISSLTAAEVKSLPERAFPDQEIVWTDESGASLKRFQWPEHMDATRAAQLEISRSRSFAKVDYSFSVEGSSAAVKSIAPGKYYWRITDINDQVVGPFVAKVESTRAPVVLFPEDNSSFQIQSETNKKGKSYPVSFYWRKKAIVPKYILQVAMDSKFQNLVVNKEVSDRQSSKEVLNAGVYYWRMSVEKDSSHGSWSPARKFIVK